MSIGVCAGMWMDTGAHMCFDMCIWTRANIVFMDEHVCRQACGRVQGCSTHVYLNPNRPRTCNMSHTAGRHANVLYTNGPQPLPDVRVASAVPQVQTELQLQEQICTYRFLDSSGMCTTPGTHRVCCSYLRIDPVGLGLPARILPGDIGLLPVVFLSVDMSACVSLDKRTGICAPADMGAGMCICSCLRAVTIRFWNAGHVEMCPRTIPMGAARR